MSTFSPGAWAVIIAAAVLLIVFRHQIHAFLTKPVQNPNFDPAKQARIYLTRSQRRMEVVATAMDQLEQGLSGSNLSTRRLQTMAGKIRSLADEQKSETVPFPFMETHKEWYSWLMDIQVRKVEDVLHTGGQNLDVLIAEEEAGARKFKADQELADKKNDEFFRELGIEPPQF